VSNLGIEAQRVESGLDTQELLVKELANRKDPLAEYLWTKKLPT